MKISVTAIFLSLSWVAFLPSSVAFAQHITFSGSNTLGLEPLVQNGSVTEDMPVLNMFDFGFESSDRHIQEIRLLAPGGDFEGNLDFADAHISSSDSFSYSVGWQLLDPVSVGPLLDAYGVCGGGSCGVSLSHHQGSANGVFALVGFDLYFQNGDHHIDTIGIQERNGFLTIEYNDKNDDDEFFWLVYFVFIPENMVQSTTTVGQGQAQGASSASTGMTSDTLISGFRFDFANSDKHIRDLAVDSSSSSVVTTRYNDKNSDDDYAWSVDLVELN